MITTLNDLITKISDKRIGKKVVLATGTFDLFHYEHLKYLEGAKKQGDILVVAIKNNKCAGLKGDGRPIIDEKQRIEYIGSMKAIVPKTFDEKEAMVVNESINAQISIRKERVTNMTEFFGIVSSFINAGEKN